MTRALVLCPGRGTYGRDSLGSLTGLVSTRLDALDAFRADLGRPTVREMDAAEQYSSRQHVRGENASILIAGVSLAVLDQVDTDRIQVVGVCGNSMGWYTALGYTGALSLADCARLIETMGQYQADNVIGGQIVYPMVDKDWRVDPDLLEAVESVVADTDGLHWSIRLGAQAVIGGTGEGLKVAIDRLPEVVVGSQTYPSRLPLHSAFHTPLMGSTAGQARKDLADLTWQSPRIPLIDGQGRIWRPRHGDPAGIRDYTLGAQVVDVFDLTTCIRTALRTVGPDVVILPGPGSSLGSAVAQVMIAEGWNGLRSRTDFINRQETDPVLISMRWPNERSRVVRP